MKVKFKEYDTLTYNKLQEMAKLLKGQRKTVKELFFEKFFPNIDNVEDYSLFIPLKYKKKINKELNKIGINEIDFKEFLIYDSYIEEITAVDLKAIERSIYGI